MLSPATGGFTAKHYLVGGYLTGFYLPIFTKRSQKYASFFQTRKIGKITIDKVMLQILH